MKRIILGLIAGIAIATSQMTHALQQLDQRVGDPATKQSRLMVIKSVEALMVERQRMCMNVIGSAIFCRCLNADLPIEVDFRKYVMVTATRGRDVAGGRLSADDRVLMDRILGTRDLCVVASFPTGK
jgi:hypothetical protein